MVVVTFCRRVHACAQMRMHACAASLLCRWRTTFAASSGFLTYICVCAREAHACVRLQLPYISNDGARVAACARASVVLRVALRCASGNSHLVAHTHTHTCSEQRASSKSDRDEMATHTRAHHGIDRLCITITIACLPIFASDVYKASGTQA